MDVPACLQVGLSRVGGSFPTVPRDHSCRLSTCTRRTGGYCMTYRYEQLDDDVSRVFLQPEFSLYSYHNAEHTSYVVRMAEEIARREQLDDASVTLVKTAALLHDIGYVGGSEGHEERSCAWAVQHLALYGYDEADIAHVCMMIRATKMPQSPTDLMSRIVCDADLAHLGSPDYKSSAERMYREYLASGRTRSTEAWLQQQIDFIASQSYHTESARQMFESQKQQHLAHLRVEAAATEAAEAGATATAKDTHRQDPMQMLRDAALVIAGVLMASVALKDFLVPNRFFDGGVTGLSLLVHELNHWSLGILIVVFNIPAIIAAYYSAGRRFATRMLVGVLLLGVSLEVLPSFPATGDKLLVAVFGGAFLGVGIGLVMRAGAALDGIEVLALYTLRRTSFTISEIILGINIILFTIAAFAFGVETALYSILTYFTASRCIDYVVEGLQAYTGVTIISSRSEAIKHILVNNLGRGITVYKGERGFLPGSYHVSSECDIIFTVITRLELRKLQNLISDVDPKAFVFASAIKDASGGIISRRHEH
ncbi:MAG: DUF2179 domain-containing protein [Candidatus Kapabacteria bacterium]|nr:DUF2179 domain-containing protein [Candidatus Kapabacteria bacterium]